MTQLPPPASRSTVRPHYWRPTAGLRTALTWLLAVDGVGALAVAGAHLNRSVAIDDYRRGGATLSQLRTADDAVKTLTGLTFFMFLATAVVLIVWQWRSAKNNELLGRLRPRFSPGWSIGGWFIPFANLVIPLRIFHDLWQGSDPGTRNYRDWHGLRRWPVIGWWWFCYVLSGALQYSVSGDTTTLADLQRADQVGVAARLFMALAAGLAIVVVRTITRRQEDAHDDDRRPIGVPAGPAWYADPTSRYDHRYWDGTTWTAHVARAGEMWTDPLFEAGPAEAR
jgi:Domain of unknown function (DUF4328)/Protein of unknown function (DUF2510)